MRVLFAATVTLTPACLRLDPDFIEPTGSAGSGADDGADGGGEGRSVRFDGIDDYVAVPDAPSLQFDRNEALTIAFWVKTETQGGQSFVEKKISGPNTGYKLVSTNAGQLQFELRANGDDRIFVETEETVGYADGSWHHVACTYDGSGSPEGVAIYLNRVLQILDPELLGVTATTVSDAEFRIGANRSGGNNLTGSLDEVAVFRAELTEAQIEELGVGSTPADLLAHSASPALEAWWRMGDDDQFPELTDQAGNNDAAMVNMPGSAIVDDAPP